MDCTGLAGTVKAYSNPFCMRKNLASAHELDDLDFGSRNKLEGIPFRPLDDAPIHLNRHTGRL